MAVTGLLNKKNEEEKYVPFFKRESVKQSKYVPFFKRNESERTFPPTERGIIDRTFGTIGNTSVVQALYNATDDDDSTSFVQGLGQGMQFMNPFHEDVAQRKSFSDVLKNLGWEDEDPDKISASDVGRGVVGFLGDVLLDPITYINPLSAAAKVVKGSGVTADGIKALRTAGVIDNVSDLTKGSVGKNNYEKLTNLSFEDAKKIILSESDNIKMDEDMLNEKVADFLNKYATKVEKLRSADAGEGLYLGLNFASKKKAGDKMAKRLHKELVSAEQLRRIGDNTIAPYYNSLARKMRVSNIGQKFSNLNKTAAIGDVEGATSSFKRFYTEELLKAYKKIPLDLDDMQVAEKLEEFWDDLTETEKYDWLIHYENGDLDAANAFLKFKGRVVDKAGESMSSADDIFSTAKGAKSNFEKQVDEFNKTLKDFVESKKSMFDDDDRRDLYRVFRQTPDQLGDFDLMTGLRYIDKMKNGSYRDLMKYYNETASRFTDVRGKIVDYTTEQAAKEAFFDKLNLDTKKALINDYYINSKSGVIDPTMSAVQMERGKLYDDLVEAFSPEKTDDGLIFNDPQAYWGERQYLENTLDGTELDEAIAALDRRVHDDAIGLVAEQASTYARLADIFEGDNYIADFAYIKKELNRITQGVNLQGKLDFDTQAMEVAELISKRMDDMAQKEVSRGMLSQAQADARKGKYLFHITNDDLKQLNTILHEDANGRYNPEILGLMKSFRKSRETGTSIAKGNLVKNKETGEFIKDAAGDYVKADVPLFEDALHDIYLARALGSNKLVYSTDTTNFIKHNFGKALGDDAVVDVGHSAVISYKDLDKTLRDEADRLATNQIKSAVGFARSPEEAKKIEFEMLAKKGEEVDKSYKGLMKSLFADEPERVKTYSANVSMQKLTDKQREWLRDVEIIHGSGDGSNIFQIQTSILDRTNVLSRAQKIEMGSSMLNLFDKLQSIWKLQNTVVTPGFHGQNSISNLFQSFLGVGADAVNPAKIRRAYHVLTTADPKQTVTLGGKTYTYKQLNHIAKKTGVIDEMFHTYEFNYGGGDGLLAKVKVPPSLDPTDIDKFFAYKWGTNVGTKIEGTQRLNMFMSALDSGHSVEEAVDVVNKFLFDYGALTEFEQETMKRIIPFYTFMKKNIPMELEQMLEQPTVFTGLQRIFQNVDKLNENDFQNEHERNEWRQDDIQIPSRIGGKSFGVADVLPYTQLERMTPNKLAGQSTPALKIPYELATGETLFTQMPIDDTWEYLANQTWWPKFYNMQNRKDEGAAKNMYILGQLLGVPINEMTQYYDYDKFK